MTFLTVLAAALAIGVALGLLGGGGTILTVPLLHRMLGVDLPHAVAMSLPIVAVAAAVGAGVAWRRGALQVAPALGLALSAALGAYGGAHTAQSLSPGTQTLLLGITLVAAAVALFIRSRRTLDTTSARTPAPARLALAGLAIGTLTGLVGVGGGFLVVPALVSFGGYTLAEAVPTSLFVIAISATSGAVGYAAVAVPWATVGVIALTAAAGVVAGSTMSRHIAPARLQMAFSVVLLLAAGYVLASR